MAEDHAIGIERIEKAQQEMQECMMVMVMVMMMMKNMMKGKNSVENPEPTNVATPQERRKEEQVFPMIYTHPKNKRPKGHT